MHRLDALAALLILTGCASTGPQTVAGLPHQDGPPKDRTRVVAADVAGESTCYGDGQDGLRVQAVYLVPADRTDRYATVAGQIRTWAAGMDQAVNASAAQQGGTAGIRWACAGGVLDVAHVVVGAAEDDSIQAIRTALQARGYGRADRKYLVWADTTAGGYCGIAFVGTLNSGPGYGEIAPGCWGFTSSTELHELAHTLSATQSTAPHGTAGHHCTDEYDRICTSADGQPMTFPCPQANEQLLDCDHDDYASWRSGDPLPNNIATSGYLQSTFGSGSPGPTPTASVSTSPAPTPTATPSPSPTATKACGKSRRPGCR